MTADRPLDDVTAPSFSFKRRCQNFAGKAQHRGLLEGERHSAHSSQRKCRCLSRLSPEPAGKRCVATLTSLFPITRRDATHRQRTRHALERLCAHR